MTCSLRKLTPCCLLLGAMLGCAHARSTAPARSPTPANILTAEDIERSPGMTLEQLLIARIPGATLARTNNGRFVIQLRADHEPLFVVDGTPLMDAANLATVDRHDVAFIAVLRDPSSTAMYGARGANGVIVIRTKGS